MSQGLAPQQQAEGDENGVQRLNALLSDSLALVDRLALPPEIGARLQEIIDAVASCADADATSEDRLGKDPPAIG